MDSERMIACEECGLELPFRVYQAQTVLWGGAYQSAMIRTEHLEHELETALLLGPNDDPQAMVVAALEQIIECPLSALVEALQHKPVCEAEQDRRAAEAPGEQRAADWLASNRVVC